MTEIEAINEMSKMHPKTCKMVNGRLQGGFDDHKSDKGIAFDMAVQALEKQIPKKPYHISQVDDNDNANVECSICHATTDYAVNAIKRGYCWKCGQLLDWENT